MIEAVGLSKTYPGVVALSNVSFSIARGEIVGFLGPNGAGKTTTMRILTSFLPPSGGTARVAGYDVQKDSMNVRRRVGYLPESNPLYTDMRVLEYLNFRAALKGLSGRDRRIKVEQAIQRAGLNELKYRIIGHLSKGQKQRVGLADAIVHDPDVLILDEPTIGLDPNQIREVRALIRELGRDKTVMLSTHILSEVEEMCPRVIIIYQGRIVADGDVSKIVRDLKLIRRVRVEVGGKGREIKEALEASIPEIARIFMQERDGSTTLTIETKDQSDIRPAVYRLAVSGGWELRELSFEQPRLEDAFARLTEKSR